ncbi:MAG: ATP-binding cassette domain-containing protein [Silicimonas sp.]|nr:ATP-binding cassette domain-containing protein [Silicimonas sp.]
MVLDLSDLSKSFAGGAVRVLDGVSLSLAAGEVVALTGESGSGKSTLLHMAAGLEPVDSGAIRFEGRDLVAMTEAERAALRRSAIGIVFQQFNLIPSLNVAANLRFQARLAGREIADFDGLVASLSLQDQLAKYPEDLSGGQQQRVAIGRALAAAPRLLLADEPTGNLDETTGDGVFELLLSLARARNAGLLIATHSERLAAAADRRVHLSHGRITG